MTYIPRAIEATVGRLSAEFPALLLCGDINSVFAAIWDGGFPRLVAEPDLDVEAYLASYVTTYLQRDVRDLLRVGDLRDFDRFLRACAARTAQMLSMSELARDVGVAVSTVKQWLSVLEASCQVLLLEPFYRNVGKRLVKTPKFPEHGAGVLPDRLAQRRNRGARRHGRGAVRDVRGGRGAQELAEPGALRAALLLAHQGSGRGGHPS